MKNNEFTSLEENKKKAKLKNVLKKRIGEYLTSHELEKVMDAVKLNRQYVIKLFFKKEDCERMLTLPKMCGGELVLGSATLGLNGKSGALIDVNEPVVAIVWIRANAVKNQIRVYLPESRKKAKYKSSSELLLCDGECVAEKFICEHIVYGEEELYCDLIGKNGGAS